MYNLTKKGSIMLKVSLFISLVFLFTACVDDKPTKNYDSKQIIEQKCASCHNLDMPPNISDDELAPPMMAVAFHVKDFVKPSDESQRISKAINFVVDYVQNPALEKSFCDKDSLKRYGLMPSQKGKITEGELKAVATYMFRYFTPKNLAKIQKEKADYNSQSLGKKLAIKNRCLGCHKIEKNTVGPALKNIAKKFKNDETNLIKSIKNGSKGSWDSSNGAIMPPFNKIKDDDLKILAKWILEQ